MINIFIEFKWDRFSATFFFYAVCVRINMTVWQLYKWLNNHIDMYVKIACKLLFTCVHRFVSLLLVSNNQNVRDKARECTIERKRGREREAPAPNFISLLICTCFALAKFFRDCYGISFAEFSLAQPKMLQFTYTIQPHRRVFSSLKSICRNNW